MMEHCQDKILFWTDGSVFFCRRKSMQSTHLDPRSRLCNVIRLQGCLRTWLKLLDFSLELLWRCCLKYVCNFSFLGIIQESVTSGLCLKELGFDHWPLTLDWHYSQKSGSLPAIICHCFHGGQMHPSIFFYHCLSSGHAENLANALTRMWLCTTFHPTSGT